MKLLIVGSGGREHALAWKLAQSSQVNEIFVAPGNAGTQWQPAHGRSRSTNVSIQADDLEALLEFARANAIDITVVGPEVPLAAGIVDVFTATNLRAFGPTQAAAQLESSKVFSKAFMQRHHIPTAEYGSFTSFDDAVEFIRCFGKSVVVKADGLAAGKGVIVCDSADEAVQAVHRVLVEGEFGSAGTKVVIEERLVGTEVSVLAFCDGHHALLMPPARDHKRVYDNDEGPNTGGMGAYCIGDMRSSILTLELLQEVRETVIVPTLRGMMLEGTPFKGVLYAGLMLTGDGMHVLEFNTRFGDPETQVILPLLQADLVDILSACINGTLKSIPETNIWLPEACAGIVMASGGYPREYQKGLPIVGLETVSSAVVYHAGTATGDHGEVLTAGGRVLVVVGRGENLAAALTRAYHEVDRIHFQGAHFRRDIGNQNLARA